VIYSKYTFEWSPYPPKVAFLQVKLSHWQGLNHQEKRGILHHRGLSCDPRLLIHCSYIKLDVGVNIHESICLEMQKCNLILCFHVYMLYTLM